MALRRSNSRRLRLERLEPRLALSAAPASAPDCGCGHAPASDAAAVVAAAAAPATLGPVERLAGVVNAYAIDWRDGSHSIEYRLDVPGSPRLNFQTAIPAGLTTGWKVELEGRRAGDSFQVTAIDVVHETALESRLLKQLVPSGANDGQNDGAGVLQQEVVVIIANFQDSNVTCTKNELDSRILTAQDSVAAFIEEASYGNYTLQGEVLSPVTIPFNSTDECDYVEWGLAAYDAATTAYGIQFDDTDHVIFVLPAASTCSVNGVALIGGIESWNFGACADKFVFAHELGHNIGFEHANALDEEGIFLEGADHSTVMGLHDAMVHFSIFEKGLVGWIPVEKQHLIIVEGTFTLSAQETLGGAYPVAAARGIGGADDILISYRAPIGFDTFLDPRFHNKVTIHSVGQLSNLRAVLSDGEVFADAPNNLWIKMVSHTADTATILVTFTPPEQIAGDYDGDTDVDGSDFLVWQRQFGSQPASPGAGADGDASGTVDGGDLDVWRDHFPTPASLAAALVAGPAEELAPRAAAVDRLLSITDPLPPPPPVDGFRRAALADGRLAARRREAAFATFSPVRGAPLLASPAVRSDRAPLLASPAVRSGDTLNLTDLPKFLHEKALLTAG